MPQPFSTLKGFGVTFRQIFKKPITQEYPEFKRPVYPRFRGRHRLHRHENGLEKCVGCSLCAAACPADCIRVVAAENTADDRVSAGERYARIYEINLSRCIFCGYCELACPFDAITLGNEFELSEYSRDDLIYTKDMLLDAPVKTVPVADPGPVRHPDPGLQGAQLARMGNVLVWVIWILAAGACLGSGVAVVTLTNPFYSALSLIGEPRLARRAVPARGRRVRGGRAGARLRGRGDGDVPVRDRLPRRPGRRAVGGWAEVDPGGGGRRVGGAPHRGGRGDGARGGRQPLRRG